MLNTDRWAARNHPLLCPECGDISSRSFIELAMNVRLRCDRCKMMMTVPDQYPYEQLDALARSLGSTTHILPEHSRQPSY